MRSSPIVELRQYTLLPGKRDVLIDLFETSFVESQEEAGMRVVGTFRDLDDPVKFVWLRGFPTMEARARSLADFYGGPVWRRHREAANSTIVDSDDVLLLRPATPASGFVLPDERPPLEAADGTDRGVVEAIVLHLDAPADDETLSYVDDEIGSQIAGAGASLLATFVTDGSPNTFPALPVREGVSVLVWFAGFPDRPAYDTARDARREIVRAAAAAPSLTADPQVLPLAPTRRSLLTGRLPTREASGQ